MSQWEGQMFKLLLLRPAPYYWQQLFHCGQWWVVYWYMEVVRKFSYSSARDDSACIYVAQQGTFLKKALGKFPLMQFFFVIGNQVYLKKKNVLKQKKRLKQKKTCFFVSFKKNMFFKNPDYSRCILQTECSRSHLWYRQIY